MLLTILVSVICGLVLLTLGLVSVAAAIGQTADSPRLADSSAPTTGA